MPKHQVGQGNLWTLTVIYCSCPIATNFSNYKIEWKKRFYFYRICLILLSSTNIKSENCLKFRMKTLEQCQ